MKAEQPTSGTILVLKNKSNISKKTSFKSGDRVKILTKDKLEKSGKIIRIDSLNIYLKKEKFPIERIYSMSKKKSFATDFLGGVMGGTGLILLFGSLSPQSSFVGDEIKNESLITGSILTATSIILLHRKTYSHKKWIFEVINY